MSDSGGIARNAMRLSQEVASICVEEEKFDLAPSSAISLRHPHLTPLSTLAAYFNLTSSPETPSRVRFALFSHIVPAPITHSR
jgi:hypothetical protein